MKSNLFFKDRDATIALRLFQAGCDISIIAEGFNVDRSVVECLIRAAMKESRHGK